jgi:pyridoxamine 5'-phosphate oxidase
VSERWVPFELEDLDVNPFVQFDRWFDDAKDVMAEREAVVLATASSKGEPSARMVLLRHHDRTSFGWYTNYDSRKGEELAANPKAALLWYCEALGRQIRIEGTVTSAPAEESDAYFATRARGSQLGAYASHQSEPLESREVLEEAVRDVDRRFEGVDVPRPSNWGGYRLTPNRFEFWQHRDDRLHDRALFLPDGLSWRRERLAP